MPFTVGLVLFALGLGLTRNSLFHVLRFRPHGMTRLRQSLTVSVIAGEESKE
ncbi:hypothetical protein LEP3755_13760 [Leptolyngbya sp. NIES-3755]|nr:hypothetical protein LEP3755_13760 [Leptolyngbya sp. NIES-3755]